LTILNAIALALLCAAAPLIKLSGSFGIVVAVLLILGRTLWRVPWPVLNRTLDRLPQKLTASVALLLFCGVVTYVGIWACYRFRYSITPDPTHRLDLSVITRSQVAQQIKNERGTEDEPSVDDINARMSHLPLSIRLLTWIDDHRLLPQAWTSANISMLTVQTRSISYLLGEVNNTGWWYYFPFAFIVKEPLTTLTCVLLAIVIAIFQRKGTVPFFTVFAIDSWSLFCIGTMLVLYGATAIASARDVGFRHVFPMLPLIYVLVGVALGRAIQSMRRVALIGVTALLVILAVETLAITPNFISFFNVAAGGSRGGLRLLSDSNLDWGQDLLALRDWQKSHPRVGLRLFYFGGADPNYYVTTRRFRKAELTAPPSIAEGEQVVAISATMLQGTFARGQAAQDYAMIRKHKPLEVLGGTIYIYPLPLRD
jgi:hypothetical protein